MPAYRVIPANGRPIVGGGYLARLLSIELLLFHFPHPLALAR